MGQLWCTIFLKMYSMDAFCSQSFLQSKTLISTPCHYAVRNWGLKIWGNPSHAPAMSWVTSHSDLQQNSKLGLSNQGVMPIWIPENGSEYKRKPLSKPHFQNLSDFQLETFLYSHLITALKSVDLSDFDIPGFLFFTILTSYYFSDLTFLFICIVNQIRRDDIASQNHWKFLTRRDYCSLAPLIIRAHTKIPRPENNNDTLKLACPTLSYSLCKIRGRFAWPVGRVVGWLDSLLWRAENMQAWRLPYTNLHKNDHRWYSIRYKK